MWYNTQCQEAARGLNKSKQSQKEISKFLKKTLDKMTKMWYNTFCKEEEKPLNKRLKLTRLNAKRSKEE